MNILTAEQVMAIAGKHQPDYCSDTHVCFDWQAIADELNAMLGRGTCKNKAPRYLDFLCSECGFVHYIDDSNCTGDGNEWNYCPKCGKQVKQ